MNRIDNLFRLKKGRILSIYFTAGYPSADCVEEIILQLDKNGADMIEIGIPYSDPLADGPVIQETSRIALANGMNMNNLFIQLESIRKKTEIPLLLMGYINPVIQFGFRSFCQKAAETGIDGLIIPDLPESEYEKGYDKIVKEYDLRNIFLITPDTSDERIRKKDKLGSGFIYMVSSASTTGKTNNFDKSQLGYFEKISAMKLANPALAGFGIYNRETMEQVFRYLNGVIIGSAYMRALKPGHSIEQSTSSFFNSLR